MALSSAERLNSLRATTVIGGHNYTGPLRRRGQEVKYIVAAIDRDLLTPPVGPAEGDHYLLPASGVLLGGWAGFANGSLVSYHSGAWVNFAATEGMRVDILDEDIEMRFTGAAWRKVSPQKTYETVGDGSNTIDVAGALNTTGCLVIINGAAILPSQITSITQDTPAQGQTRIVFTFNVAAVDSVLILG